MTTYVIRVDGILHHATSREVVHEAYVGKLREAGYDVTTEVLP